MKYPVDLRLFDLKAHNPSFFSLVRSLKRTDLKIVDFCVPCNPYFPTKEMFQQWAANLEDTLKYYPTDSSVTGEYLSELLGLDPETVVLANGSTELISWIDILLMKESIATPIPTFGRWTDQPRESGKTTHLFRMREDDDFSFNIDEFIAYVRHCGAKSAVLCNPNNPTGGYVKKQDVIRMLDQLADLDLIVVDESFIDFVEAETSPSVAQEAIQRDNVIVLKSLGKNFGLHGVRFGYTVSNPTIARKLRLAVPRWNINSVAEMIVFSIGDHLPEYRRSLQRIFSDRRSMFDQLSHIPDLTVYPSQGNFLLIRLPRGVEGTEFRDYLLTQHGVFIRECGNKQGIDSRFVRVVCRPATDVARLTRGIQDFLLRENWTLPLESRANISEIGHR